MDTTKDGTRGIVQLLRAYKRAPLGYLYIVI